MVQKFCRGGLPSWRASRSNSDVPRTFLFPELAKRLEIECQHCILGFWSPGAGRHCTHLAAGLRFCMANSECCMTAVFRGAKPPLFLKCSVPKHNYTGLKGEICTLFFSELGSWTKWGQLVIQHEEIIIGKLKSMDLWQFTMDRNLPSAVDKALKLI